MTYEITSLNDQGLGICYVNNKITFVKNAVINDIVTIKIIKEFSKYNIAIVDKYIKYSNKRINSKCPYFEKCGGCILQNLKYEDTLKFKKDKLESILHKFANINTDVKIVSNANDYNYRNKVSLKVVNKVIGYYSYNSNDIVKIDRCEIASKAINKVILKLEKFNIINGDITIRSNYKNEILIIINSSDDINIDNIDNIDNVVGIIKNKKVVYGQDYFIDKIGNKLFKVSYDSFFQVNNYIIEKIFDDINKYILKNSNVLDLYCGVGTLGINVSNTSNKIVGIEYIENAINNAKENALINNLKKYEYYLGDVSNVILKIKDNIDVIICDPPRSGLNKKTIESILNINPKQIIYVSCDPITLSRDLKVLLNNYKIDYIKGYDMFSYTYHLETLVVLNKK